MSDWLVELGANPTSRNIVKSLGLPIPLPAALPRDRDGWRANLLAGRRFLFEGHSSLRATFEELGATNATLGDAGKSDADVLVVDARDLATVAELARLHTFFGPRASGLKSGGRAILIGKDAPGGAALLVRHALEGFVKSLAKEIGGKGATANLVIDGGGSVEGPAAFFASRKSAFITGQVVVADAAAEGAWARPLEGKVAIVTGAARGIGEATARILARDGAHVFCIDRDAEKASLEALATAIGGAALTLDVTAFDAGDKLLAAIAPHGGFDVIVHNAGITRDKTIARMKRDAWDAVIAVNLEAIVRITDALAPKLRDGGRIVALSSIAGIAGNMGQTNYAATKAAVIGFVKDAQNRFGARGITANAIAPGFIETQMTAKVPVPIREAGRRLSALAQGGMPEDVAEAITFLAHPKAGSVRGRVLRVCGGSFIGA
jgi:3-oxoacyl-[acyl-carrier protein] reductase